MMLKIFNHHTLNLQSYGIIIYHKNHYTDFTIFAFALCYMMIRFKSFVLFLFVLLWFLDTNSQTSISEGSVNVPMLGPGFSFQMPAGDLSERFGSHFTIGVTFLNKTPGNLMLGLDAGFIFGNNLNDALHILDGITTEHGFIIDKFGSPANVFLYERGMHLSAKAGKLFPVVGPNVNSGLFFTVGLGYFQHKIRIENLENTVPQVQGNYRKGYDKLTGGPAVSQFIGYLHLSNSRLFNFYAGLEFTQAFTQSLRTYDFNLMARDEKNRFDACFGLKTGWMIPLHKRAPDDYYYY